MSKVVRRIYGHGRGWVFTKKDLADCGGSMAVEKALPRLRDKGTIRQILRGVYDYPRISSLFNAPSSPIPDQMAQAIARSNGWSIYPSGDTALNLLGLSTQMVGKYIYFSDGPSKKYSWSGGDLIFKKRAIKETAQLSARTALIVQALKSLGKENVNQTVIEKLCNELTIKEIKTALREAKFVTSWVYEVIKKIADEMI